MSSPIVHGSRPSRLKRTAAKVLHEPAYILHTQPYRDTSLLMDVFTRHHGRVSVLAKGAKRPYTQWRASTFQTFQTLSMSFTSKSDVKTLLDVEWVGGIPMLTGAALISGYYMNEWLRRSLVRDQVNEGLFDAYQHSLADLSLSTVSEHAQALRGFEFALLRELGYAVPLDTQGEIEPDRRYQLVNGVWTANQASVVAAMHEHPTVHGQTLLDLKAGELHQSQTLQEAKGLFRYLLHTYVGDKPLHTRKLLIDLQGLA